jgi:hypothetical protein
VTRWFHNFAAANLLLTLISLCVLIAVLMLLFFHGVKSQ